MEMKPETQKKTLAGKALNVVLAVVLALGMTPLPTVHAVADDGAAAPAAAEEQQAADIVAQGEAAESADGGQAGQEQPTAVEAPSAEEEQPGQPGGGGQPAPEGEGGEAAGASIGGGPADDAAAGAEDASGKADPIDGKNAADEDKPEADGAAAGAGDASGKVDPIDGKNAADEDNPEADGEDKAAGEGESTDKPDTDKPDTDKPADADAPAFSASAEVDGVKITVAAGEGTFPEGCTLQAAAVPNDEEYTSEANVALSHTYDIKVLDKDGKEIQPADGKKVSVTAPWATTSWPTRSRAPRARSWATTRFPWPW